MSAESPRHARSGGPLTVPSQPPSDRSIIDAVSGFINDVTLSSSSNIDPKDVIQWARFETADINEPTPEGDSDNDISPLLLILGYGAGVQVWLISPNAEAQEVLSWRQGTVRVLRILPTPQHGDCFASKRPLIALCDSASPGPTFCSLSFISIRCGEQVKSIKFKNPILDVLANKRSVVVSFSERFAVFDAATLEDRMCITTCYPCPCPFGGSMPINPLALGDRWLAYADKKLNQSKRSSGGCECEGVSSYTATVLHAAKSLSKGLRGLGESVAQSLSGGRSTSQSPSPPNADIQQPGVVTILDIESNDEEDGQDVEEPWDPMVAHFVAHSEAIIALKFDASGMLLVTADRRGHDFHVFRINPHPCGPSLASVHHLYILHRGDTTAKVQDIAISADSRWAAVSTLRGTTHVFALSAYGGPCGVRTHTQPRVVNRLSRFHRSAGLPIHAHATPKRASGSPVGDGLSAGSWFPNPRLPPYPQPTTAAPLAQIRPTANLPTHTITRTSSGRQRLSSLSEDSNIVPLLARARFGPVGVVSAPGAGPAAAVGAGPPRGNALAALYLVTADGTLLNLLLHPRPLSSLPKEKISDDSPIEVHVEGVAQWALQRPAAAADLLAPLPPANPLLRHHPAQKCADICMSEEERWLSQVEIVTHAGPHRRLWMGPQFVFKTYNCTGSSSSLSEAEAVEVDACVARGVARSNPVNMPGVRPLVPVLIDSGSASSLEHSPSDSFRRKSLLSEGGRAASLCDVQLREDLAEAMKEDHGWLREESVRESACAGVARSVDPLGCVVAARGAALPPPLDADAHTRANSDEASFRPVVRAPAALPPRSPPLLRPLPRTTTIPVQPLPPAPHDASPTASPLQTCVLIPAALDALPLPRPCADPPTDISCKVSFTPPPAPACVARPDAVRLTDERVKADVPPPAHPRDHSEERRPESKKSSRSTKTRPAGDSSVERLPKTELSVEPTAPVDVPTDRAVKEAKESSSIKIGSINDDSKQRSSRRSGKVKQVDVENVSVEVVTEPSLAQELDEASRDTDSASTFNYKLDKKADQQSATLPPASSLGTSEKKSLDDVEYPPPVLTDETATMALTEKPETSLREKISPLKSSGREQKSNKEEPFKVSDKELKKSAALKITLPPARLSKKSEKSSEDKESPRNKFSIDVLPEKIEKTYKEKSPNRDKEDTIVEEPKAPVPSARNLIKSSAWAHDIKTEDQAWDMLLSEPEKPQRATISPSTNIAEKLDDPKPKVKKNRKIKKTQDETQASVDEDSFVEIHAIEEKQQPSCGDLVSISSPFEDVDTCSTFVAKSKKRSSKSLTPEKLSGVEHSVASFNSKEMCDVNCKLESNLTDILTELSTASEPMEGTKVDSKSNTLNISKSIVIDTDTTNLITETFKSRKAKSLSPYADTRKAVENVTKEIKDVYVIDSTKDEFPEIQITTRLRRKSPHSAEMVVKEQPSIIEKPVKSWSSIAASKNIKKGDDLENKLECEDKNVDNFLQEAKYVDKIEESRVSDAGSELGVNKESSKRISLQEKLYELCKRRDIMVAECDAPSQLNFVEEHHSDIHELPPLEPLDFGLDDFKLEVMRDSLLDVSEAKLTSPICKINIDDILSTIKETTSKAIENSPFNLIDLEKVPARKERGFSVIESHKITSQEIKIDDDLKTNEREAEIMEKSSDDDNTSPMISTDSDKEDKKLGAAKAVLPSVKQTAKTTKKPRKKKK